MAAGDVAQGVDVARGGTWRGVGSPAEGGKWPAGRRVPLGTGALPGPQRETPQPRIKWPRPALPSALLLPGPAAPFPGPQLGSRTSCGEPRTWGAGRGGGGCNWREMASRVGCEARQVAHSRCLRSPASAWSPSSPNAPYRGSSRPLSPPRMADGGSPFLGRRDFVYPSSTRGKGQILPFCLPDACHYAPDMLVPRGVAERSQSPVLSNGARRGSQLHPSPVPTPRGPPQAQLVLLHRP